MDHYHLELGVFILSYIKGCIILGVYVLLHVTKLYFLKVSYKHKRTHSKSFNCLISFPVSQLRAFFAFNIIWFLLLFAEGYVIFIFSKVCGHFRITWENKINLDFLIISLQKWKVFSMLTLMVLCCWNLVSFVYHLMVIFREIWENVIFGS